MFANGFDDNRYLVLLGIEAPIEMDASSFGKKTLEAELMRFDSLQKIHELQILDVKNDALNISIS